MKKETAVKPFKPLWLDCGCCGRSFQTWPEYQDQDQDAGYGICRPCQEDIGLSNHFELLEAFKLIEDNLDPIKRMVFKGFPLERKTYIVHRAIEDGIITWQIK